VNVDFGILGKLTRFVVFLLFIAGLLGVAVWYLPLIQQNERLQKHILKLDTEISQQEELSRQLKGSIDAFRDPKNVERYARWRLGYAKPGETVIRFEAAPTNSPARF
jgi:cell division protein FtsB